MQAAAEHPNPDILPSTGRSELRIPVSLPRLGTFSGSIRAAFLATAHVAPIIALFISVAAYALAPSPSDQAASPVSFFAVHPLAAVVINLVMTWSALAAVYLALGCTSAERANTGAFADLQDALIGLQSQLEQLCPDQSQQTPKFCELVQYKENLTSAIETRGPQWVLGYGYMSLLRRAHRAEETLITVQDKRIVIAGARYDLLRILESTLANKIELVAGLECAARFLRGGCQDDTSEEQTTSHTMPSQRMGEMGLIRSHLIRVPSSEEEARTILRDVRRSINDFRDGIQAGFIRARNHLLAVTIFTGFSLYCLLWLAIISGMTPDLVKTMAAYYLVGILIGLFARLNVESQNDTAVDDFGLSATRLISGPLMSGVAAVGGVLTVTLLSFSQQIGNVTPESSALIGLLNMTNHPLNLLVAATFGLTPTLLLDRLKQQADKYKQDLRSSEPLQKSPVSSNGSSNTA
jgi:hypothetical protein